MNSLRNRILASAAMIALAAGIPATVSAGDYRQGGMQGGKGDCMRDGSGQGMMRRGDGPRSDGPQRFMARFAAIDVNEDGRVSDEEASSQRESVFLAMDSDDDGELTQEEYMAVRMGPVAGEGSPGNGQGMGEGQGKGKGRERKLARFAPMDGDSSGTVSKAEWMKAGEERFKAADADGDGTVTPWEFRAVHRL